MRKTKFHVIFEGKVLMGEFKELNELTSEQDVDNSEKNNFNAEDMDSKLKNIERIKNLSVEDLYHICNISKSMPISFDRLLRSFKIRIMGTDFNFISKLEKVREQIHGQGLILGMVNIENGYANIYYNNNPEIDIPRQRFTIAHELAHCVNHYDILSKCGQVEFLHDDIKQENDINSNDEDQDEYLREYVCNKFARDFLIPTDLLKKVIGIMNKPSVVDLSELFMVPSKEMQIKLDEIGYKYG